MAIKPQKELILGFILLLFITLSLKAGTVVQINSFKTWKANPQIIPSTDPAGILYATALGRLLIADSEINENGAWNNENIFETSLNGLVLYNTYRAKPPLGSIEPTGITYNPLDGYYYTTNDDRKSMYRYEIIDVGGTPTFNRLKDWLLSGPPFNGNDDEGITINPVTGRFYIANGSKKTGKTQVIALEIDQNDNLVYIASESFDTPALPDVEGIAFHNDTGHLFLVSAANGDIAEYTVTGTLVQVWDLSIPGVLSPAPIAPQGLSFGPRSTNGSLESLYIADGGIDNNQTTDSTLYSDGVIYEVDLGLAPAVPPFISNFTPTSGSVGTLVTINGSGFTGTTTVLFNGTASSFTPVSDTQIQTSVPSGATTGKIKITNSAGSDSSSTNFTVTGPIISSFLPAIAQISANVIIRGSNFTGASKVAFNGTQDLGFTVLSDTAIQSSVPSGATTGVISVTTSVGTGNSSKNFTITQSPVVTGFETWNASPRVIPSTDPAGILYSSVLGRLIIVDSEINESTPPWNNENVFVTAQNGDTLFSTYATDQTFLVNHEPTGIAYNPLDGFYYITNDNTKSLYRYQLSGGSFTKLATWDINSLFGINDPEGITINPATGRIYIADGMGGAIKIWAFDVSGSTLVPVASETFGLSPTMNDVEGISYQSETGHLYLVTSDVMAIFEYDVNGTFLRQISISSWTPTPISPQGLSFGPRSTNSSVQSLYVADAGLDNGTVSFPTWADGMIYETSIGTGNQPTIASFSPSSGIIGSTVKISGTFFSIGDTVTINGIMTPIDSIKADTSLFVKVPSNAQTGKIIISINGSAYTSLTDFTVVTPTITLTGTLSAFSTVAGTPSAEQTYSVAGSNLTGDITLTAPTGFDISLTTGTGFTNTLALTPTSGTVGTTTIFVRLNSATDSTFSGNITHISSGATQQDLAVSGTVGPVLLSVKVFLEGPYDSTKNKMKVNLWSTNFIPKASPYTENPRVVTVIPDSVVDWVLIQLRQTPTGPVIISKSVFLRNNGKIVADDGITEQISMDIPSGNYYIVVKHRNHLAIMSAAAQTLANVSSLYDFSSASSQYYGSGGAHEIAAGVWGMITGDGNGDGGVFAEDYILYQLNQGVESYHMADFNLDGGVFAEDYIFYQLNQGEESAVP